MKIVILILVGLCVAVSSAVGATSAETAKAKVDLTQFDQPFMLGDWYLFNPSPSESDIGFSTIRLHIASDYRFSIEIQNLDNSVDYWHGDYGLSADTLILGLNSDTPQIYRYHVNHNQLLLNGIQFYKGYPSELVGQWSSEEIGGEDILASNVSKVTLTIQPDFIFLFMSESSNGGIVAYQGVYYLEGDNLVLMYEKGEQNSRYIIKNDLLTLRSDEVDMYAVMNRLR